MEGQTKQTSPTAIAIAGIILPGLGYWLLGERKRAILAGGGVLLMFVLGLFFAGIRVINVPGYEDGNRKYVEFHRGRDAQGREVIYPMTTTQPCVAVERAVSEDAMGSQPYIVKRLQANGSVRAEKSYDPPLDSRWVLLYQPIAVIGDNLWFLGQVLTGPICAVSGYISIEAARAGIDRSYGRLADIGALYTAVAGMMNLMVIVDGVARASRKEGSK